LTIAAARPLTIAAARVRQAVLGQQQQQHALTRCTRALTPWLQSSRNNMSL
jgi:hypothetical protein